jgi:hypothetical protein
MDRESHLEPDLRPSTSCERDGKRPVFSMVRYSCGTHHRCCGDSQYFRHPIAHEGSKG